MSDRWMAEIFYLTGEPKVVALKVVTFEELEDLHNIIELGPDWNTITSISVTLNRPCVRPKSEATA